MSDHELSPELAAARVVEEPLDPDFFEPNENGRAPATGSSTSLTSALSVADSGWPAPVNEAAFHGLAGRVVRAIEPHSEADPVALLVQCLVMVGSLVGRGPYFTVEADQHRANLYATLVGESSKARKGSSWGHNERLGRSVDPSWGERIESGLTSGEGLLWAVRDPEQRAEGEDEGVADKRLLIFESEFANVLRVLERQGNRLSTVVRDAWDGRPLRTLTRTTAAKATGAHISIVGHITTDELRRYLDRTEVANGFGNRFLWLGVRRSKLLPEGGRMHTVDVEALVRDLREAVRFAGTVGRVERDDEARERWHEIYAELSEGRPGIAGALTGRAEAQVLRLALVYALLDLSDTIRLPHLEAALAFWDYSLRSVVHIFGASLGDPTADTILDAIRRAAPGALSRTEIRTAVGGRTSGDQIDRALALLARHRLAHDRRAETGGRPSEQWQLGPKEGS